MNPHHKHGLWWKASWTLIPYDIRASQFWGEKMSLFFQIHRTWHRNAGENASWKENWTTFTTTQHPGRGTLSIYPPKAAHLAHLQLNDGFQAWFISSFCFIFSVPALKGSKVRHLLEATKGHDQNPAREKVENKIIHFKQINTKSIQILIKKGTVALDPWALHI